MGAEGAGGRGAQLEVERIRRELVALYRRHNETKVASTARRRHAASRH
jgi:hypothetical protein